jgi:hypothetical protein
MNKKNRICVGEERSSMDFFKGLVLAALLFLLFFILPIGASAQVFLNKNVTTKVNITNAAPDVLALNITSPIILNAGSSKTVYCNATIRDWNGHNDILGANATFYYYTNQSNSPDNNNSHYTNTTCVEASNDGNFTSNYTCTFSVLYFASNGSWYCNVSAWDNKYFTSLNSTASITALYALNVTDIIDYGNLSVNDYSNNTTAIVTNFGNMNVNVSVLGYGTTQGDGVGLVCQYGGNISVQNERFSSNISADWGAKTVLATTNKDAGVTIAKQTLDGTPVTATTYWQLYVPPNPFGICTGTVRFTATAP